MAEAVRGLRRAGDGGGGDVGGRRHASRTSRRRRGWRGRRRWRGPAGWARVRKVGGGDGEAMAAPPEAVKVVAAKFTRGELPAKFIDPGGEGGGEGGGRRRRR